MDEVKAYIEGLSGKPILVFGLGRSGVSVARALSLAGAKVVVGDDNPDNYESLSELDVEYLDDVSYGFSDYEFLVLSPGIPFTHPEPHSVVRGAQGAGIEIICDLELFHRIYQTLKTIAITGTNGKSTTAALTHHILQSCNIPSELGGNIGTPVFDLEVANKEEWVVIEISSFQIDLCPTYRPDIAVILNLTPDHLDRHGTMENYAAVKTRLAEEREGSTYNHAVICVDDPYTQKISAKVTADGVRNLAMVSTTEQIADGVSVIDGVLFDSIDQEPVEIGSLLPIKNLVGGHNHQNAACAYAIARKVGLEDDQIWSAMEKFEGLAHRQNLVRTINGVTYVNDSKATNAASAAVALGCRSNVYWIVGGRKKQTGLDGLEEFFTAIKHAFLIGETTDDFANWFDKYGVGYTKVFELEAAVNAAHQMAQDNRGQPGGAGVVLLSPAAASFDQFSSYEERGDRFVEFVNALEG